MISIDRIAYCSRLRKIDPIIKVITALTMLFIGLLANSYLVSGIIIIVLNWAVVRYGGTSIKELIKLNALPLSFLLMSIITIIIQRMDSPKDLFIPIQLSFYYYGIYITKLDFVGRLILKAIGAISCMYFLALTTPMTELFSALRRMKVSKLLVELMELIYRFIFVLSQTAGQIYIAQSSRLGYNDLRISYKSLGILVSMLFVRAYKRSDRIYNALELRGYSGEISTMDIEYDSHIKYYIISGSFLIFLIAVYVAERLW